MRKCPKCGELNGDNNEYCYKCKTLIGPVECGRKRCPKCDIPYPSSKTYCDVCGESLLSSQGTTVDSTHYSNISDTLKNKAPQKGHGCLIALVLVIAIIIIGFFAIDSCGSSSGNDDLTAWTCAQTIVKDNLKSPSSADFCAMKDATITNNGNRYTIIGYVDADNSFGAHIRSTFTVTFTLTDKGCENVRCNID